MFDKDELIFLILTSTELDTAEAIAEAAEDSEPGYKPNSPDKFPDFRASISGCEEMLSEAKFLQDDSILCLLFLMVREKSSAMALLILLDISLIVCVNLI